MGWILAIVGVNVGLLFTYSICNAASKADDIMLGDHQYDEN